MNDEFPRRRPEDAEPDWQPDYGFGAAPLFRDEVPPPQGPNGAAPGPGVSGFHDASLFRDPAARYGGGDPLGTLGDSGSDFGMMGGGPVTQGAGGFDYGSGGDYGTGILSSLAGGAGALSGSGRHATMAGEYGSGSYGTGEYSPSGYDAGGYGTGEYPAGDYTNGASASENYGTGEYPVGGYDSRDTGVPPQRFGGQAEAAGTPPPDGTGGDQNWGPNEGPLRVVPADQASALLRIKLPDAPPVPATTLRGDAQIEEVVEASQMLHRVSPAKPNALPGDVLALTTATMVVPMPGAAFGGVRTLPRSARLTASVPPDLASRAEADLLSDTVEQFFGDFDAIGRELEARRGSGLEAGAGSGAKPQAPAMPAPARHYVPAHGGDPGRAEWPQPGPVPGQYAPGQGAPPAGRYGVPTQVPGYDAARRSPVGMRYLGGIFHDSSGESSFYDPSTESLVPMGAAAFSASDFRRTAPAVTGPVPPPRTGPRATPPRGNPASAAAPTGARSDDTRRLEYRYGSGADGFDEPDATRVLPRGHWSDHHPDHHRSRRGSRRGRVALVSALAVTLAFGTLYGAALALEGQVPQGTVVDGVAIGGMSRADAEARLAGALGPSLNAPLRLTADGTTFQLRPDQSGLRVDYAGTVSAAAAGRTDPTVAIPSLVGSGREVPLRVSIDRSALKTALTNLTAGFAKAMVDGSVIFPGGVPTPVAPRPGREIDVDAAVDAVVSAFDDGVASVHLAAVERKGSPQAPGAALPTAPAAYAIGPAKPAFSPVHHTASAAVNKYPATPAAASSSSSSTAATPAGATGSASATPTPTPTPTVPVSAATAASTPATPATPPAPPASTGSFPAAPVALTVRIVQPTVTPAAVAQAMQDFARPAMSGAVVLVTGSVRTVLKPAVLGRHLAIEPDGHGALVPKLDGAGIRTELDHDALAKLEQPATEATFTVTGGQPVLVPGKNGVGYSPAAIQNAVLPVLTKSSSSQRVATVPIGPLPPTLTTEAAQALGIRDVMGLYTAPFSAAAQRTANVKNAAALVRGQVLQPGQVFSLNQVLGARSAANGFVPAAADASAAAPALDAGSGSSLVATALFNAEYLAGLKDVEHHPHATVTDHFPPGMEAAVSYPDVDLKFQNDSGAPVYLWTSATDNAVTVAVLGRRAYDSVQTETSPHYALVQPKTTYSAAGSCTAGDGVPGFQVDVTRVLTKAGQDPVRQVFHSTYAAQDKVVCGSAGSGPAGGSPSGTPTGAVSTTSPPAATQGGTAESPNTPSGTPTGASSGGASSSGGSSSSGSDGSLLGGLLGAPSSRH